MTLYLVELWSAEADMTGKNFLMFNQFCYSCVRRARKRETRR